MQGQSFKAAKSHIKLLWGVEIVTPLLNGVMLNLETT